MYWDPMWGISILADFRPMGISIHAVAVFGLGKNLLFKSVLGRCVIRIQNYQHNSKIQTKSGLVHEWGFTTWPDVEQDKYSFASQLLQLNKTLQLSNLIFKNFDEFLEFHYPFFFSGSLEDSYQTSTALTTTNLLMVIIVTR